MKFLNRKPKKRLKDAICLFEVTGKNVDVIITHTKDQKVIIAKKKRPLPENSYYLNSVKVLGELDLSTPIRAFIVDRDAPINLEFANQLKDENGNPAKPDWSNDSTDLMMNDNIFKAMFQGLSMSKMQAFLYGCMGIVLYEIFGGFLTLMIQAWA